MVNFRDNSSCLFKIYWIFIIIVFCMPVLTFAKTTKSRRVSTPSARVKSVKYWTGPETTQVAVYFQGRVSYNISSLPGKTGFVLRAERALPEEGDQVIEVNDGVVSRIDISGVSGGTNITVRFMEPVEYHVSSEHKDRNFPVIEVIRPTQKQPVKLTSQQVTELKKNNKIVVIDPGHGGWHYGAGANGLVEKSQTMELALRLKEKLDKVPGVKTFLTRDVNFNQGDYYVSLPRRREIAADLGADLFISLHLNAPGSPSDHSARGTEIYFLAYGDASDAEAQRLADLENAADLVPEEVNRPNDIVSELLLDERLIALNNQSSLLAGLVLNNLLKLPGLTDRGVKNARFAVLKCKMPSVLLELAFVTNPNEVRLLQDPQFYNEVSDKMLTAVNQYFTINPGRMNGGGPNGVGAETSSTEDVLSNLLKTNPAEGDGSNSNKPVISPR